MALRKEQFAAGLIIGTAVSYVFWKKFIDGVQKFEDYMMSQPLGSAEILEHAPQHDTNTFFKERPTRRYQL